MKCSDFSAVNERPNLDAYWEALGTHARQLQRQSITALFQSDPLRFQHFSLPTQGIVADFSKQRVDAHARKLLLELFARADTPAAIAALFDGHPLNFTENRPALHMAWRGGSALCLERARQLQEADQRMHELARTLRAGRYLGATGRPVEQVVNLGIGGSDLGPRMAAEALKGLSEADESVKVRFVASLDPAELDAVLQRSDPETTVFIVSSKSFTTVETLANARVARQWLEHKLGASRAMQHMLAITQERDAAQRYGIPPDSIVDLPEWVGGRYSVWSGTGLPLLIAIGEEAFDRFRRGARDIDQHFRDTPAAENLPVMMALYGLWNINVLNIESHAVLPYAHGLRSFPTWLQQLDMESNGKHCRRDGTATAGHTAPIVWGAAGTTGQHAFHQLLYQGTHSVALDFIVPLLGAQSREQLLLENALAQSEALMRGRDLEQAREKLAAQGCSAAEIERLAPHLVCRGGQPSTTLLLPGLDAYRLGQLLALYEHKTFVQGWIWGINSFDQYGVELGKEMARSVAETPADTAHPSTAGLLAAVRRMRQGN